MSNLSFMEKLLNGAKVEWKTLAEIAIIGTGSRNTNEAIPNGRYPFFVRSQEPLTIDDFEFDETAIITAGDGVGVGKVFHYVSGKYSLHQRAYRISVTDSKVNSKFLFHFIRNDFSNYLKTISVHASVTSLRKPMFEKYPIPIPPLDIQNEIVRILDNFTELTTNLVDELKAELTARNKQYEYYRELLLTPSNSPLSGGGQVEWKSLGEVGELIRGNGLQKKDFTETGVPAIHYGQIYTKYGLSANKTFVYVSEELAKKLRIANKNDLLIATTSENDEDVLKPVAWLGEQVAISGDMMLLRHNQNVKYLAYYFQTQEFQTQKIKYVTGTKVRRVSRDSLAKFVVPIPPIPKQEHIVAILDKFDSLTTSITEGLPREIKLRQQQYEYYYDLLLSFPKDNPL